LSFMQDQIKVEPESTIDRMTSTAFPAEQETVSNAEAAALPSSPSKPAPKSIISLDDGDILDPERDAEMALEAHAEVQMDEIDAAFAEMERLTSMPDVPGVPSTLKGERSSNTLEDYFCAKESSKAARATPKSIDGGEKRKRAPPKTDHSACIHPDLGTIVPDIEHEGCWVELRCGHCGSNYDENTKKFYTGRRGMLRHYVHSHKDLLADGESWKMPAIITGAAYHLLSKDESGALLRGDMAAYDVPSIAGKTKAKHP
jgi:hypothetical protein